MPADIEVMADCASNYGVFRVQGRTGTYTVSFNGSEGPAYCTCQGFRFSHNHHCKHIQQVWDGACMFNPQWCDGHKPVTFKALSYNYDAIIPGEHCPACGGPVVAVRRAV